MISLTVSTVGFGFFSYGRKRSRLPQLSAGLCLMVYPYFVGSVPWMLAVGAAMLAGLWLSLRMGL